MSTIHLDSSAIHQGYMAGLKGENPDEAMAKSEDYSDGWLVGSEDRQKRLAEGVPEDKIVPKYLGPCTELPMKKGDKVSIPKGTIIDTINYGKRAAGRTYQVTLHDVYPGVPAHRDLHHGYNETRIVRPTEPQLLWPGTSGYWSTASLNEVLEKAAEKA